MRAVPLPGILSFTVIGLAALLLAAGPASADDITVDVGNLYFCSSTFEGGVCESTVTAGDTVTWSVSAGFHTVTQCDAAFSDCGGGFDSGDLESGNTFVRTFDTAGTYPYLCEFHPDEMMGRIVVTQPTPTPTPAPTTPGQTAVPAVTFVAVPKTGGPPPDSATDVLPLMLAAVGLALIGTSGVALAFARNRS